MRRGETSLFERHGEIRDRLSGNGRGDYRRWDGDRASRSRWPLAGRRSRGPWRDDDWRIARGVVEVQRPAEHVGNGCDGTRERDVERVAKEGGAIWAATFGIMRGRCTSRQWMGISEESGRDAAQSIEGAF